MKLLLVTSPHLDHTTYHRRRYWDTFEGQPRYAQCFAPMGLVSLAGAVDSVAEVSIADVNKAINSGRLPMSKNFYDEAANWLLESGPGLVGFMTEADSYHHVLRIIQSIKAHNPQVLSLLGGPHASAVHRETLHSFPEVDFIVRGEGEVALRALVEALEAGRDLAEVGNLTFREKGSVLVNSQLPLIADLDTLPWPDFSRISLLPEDLIYVEIGRGCPFSCNFCFTAPYWQRKHRIKSPKRILQELAYFKNEYGRTDFNFTHDLFTTNRRWVLEFCKVLAASDLNVTWTCSSRTDTIDEEQIYWLRQAGCRNIYFGVEAGTAEMQTNIDKNLDLDEARHIIGKTSEAGIGVTVGFIAGLPGESRASLRGTLKEAFGYLRLPGATVHLFGYSPYRGSVVFERIKSELRFDPHFVDFPLSDEVHRENCALMTRYFELFSRYSWPASYDDLDVATVSAAEEYFPMVNALCSFMLALNDRGVDPLDLLSSWAEWAAARNQAAQSDTRGLYQGTIQDFLNFIEWYLNRQGQLDPIAEEMLKWESLKNMIRIQSYVSSIPAMFNVRTVEHDQAASNLFSTQSDNLSTSEQASSDEVRTLYTNPSVVTGHFEHAHEFISDLSNPEPGVFAFYMYSDGKAAIVRLPPIAAVILDLAEKGVPAGELLDLTRVERDDTFAVPLESQMLSMVLEQLERVQLLLSADQLLHFTTIAPKRRHKVAEKAVAIRA